MPLPTPEEFRAQLYEACRPSPEAAALRASIDLMNRVEHAMSLPPRSAVSPLRVIRFEEEERGCSYCGYPIEGEGPWCSPVCKDEYEKWEAQADDCDPRSCDHGEEG